MAAILKDKKVVTLINVFTVETADQQKVLDLLVNATEETMKNLPDLYQQVFIKVSTECELSTMPSGGVRLTSRR
jgi:hypothetical protein